jgi:tRNA pseudouridine55 synthase
MASGVPILHGWINLDKPTGLGSTQAVGAVKRLLREAGQPRTKVGHGGTLDPLASGVLPIALGEATKLAGRMLDATKRYDFTIGFGEETDTLDAEGQVIERSDYRPTPEDIEAVLPRFTGLIEQVPPAFSALKIDGKPAYARSRAGEQLEMTSRSVTIHELRLLGSEGNEATLSATVSKGTYIRSLARDIARALGTVGHVAMLRRTRAGPFGIDEAISLDFLATAAKEQRLDGAVLPLVAALDDIPALPVTPGQAQLLRHGQTLAGFPELPGLALAMDDDRPVAMVEALAGGLRVVRGFNL